MIKITMEDNSSKKAGIINRRGEAFSVSIHPYVRLSNDFVCWDNFVAAVELYLRCDKDKEIARDTILYYIYSQVSKKINSSMTKDIINLKVRIAIKQNAEDADLPWEEIYKMYLQENIESEKDINEFLANHDPKKINDDIYRSFNQQFLRFRFGGKYVNEGVDGVYFRISSTGFDWYDIIYSFVSNNKSKCKLITIEKDEQQGIGDDCKSYIAKDKTKYNSVPIDEFLSEAHGTNPEFENKKTKKNYLKKGGISP